MAWLKYSVYFFDILLNRVSRSTKIYNQKAIKTIQYKWHLYKCIFTGRQKNRWEDNINEWTGMGFGDSLSAAEDREGWKCIVATSSVVP